MSSPTPVQSFLGGIGLSLPVHALLLLNGNVFGISGFLHRAVLGGKESICAVLGLILGGTYVGFFEGHGPSLFQVGLGRVALAGFFVGVGSKLSNGCTSGHMICGLSRFSFRSFIATLTFFVTGVATVQLLPHELPHASNLDWSLGPNGQTLLITHLSVTALLSSFAIYNWWSAKNAPATSQPHLKSRLLVFLITGFQFALALRFSNLSEPTRVLSFLSLPFRPAFDPSLAFLAAGALPMSITLYQFFRGSEKPVLGTNWSITQGGSVDKKLITGAALFGIGWGLAGICPGPGLVNLGRALSAGSGVVPAATWLAGVAIGGLLA